VKNKKRAAPPLRNGASDKEVIRWVKTHDVFDRLDAGVSELVDDHNDLDRILEETVFQYNHELAEGYRTMADENRETAERGLPTFKEILR